VVVAADAVVATSSMRPAALAIAALVLAECAVPGARERWCRDLLRTRELVATMAQCGALPAGRLARSWHEDYAERREVLTQVAEGLVGTNVTADAAYLAGYLHLSSGAPARYARGRSFMRGALALYRFAGRYELSGRCLVMLSRDEEARLEASLALAQAAAEEAKRVGDPLAVNAAETALAEAYADVGMVDEARDAFVRAAEQGRGDLVALAFTYLKHGRLLSDLPNMADKRASVDYFALSERLILRSEADEATRETIAHSAAVNSAATLVELERLDEALAHLDRVLRTEPWQLDAIRGQVLAARGDLTSAKALAANAKLDQRTIEYRTEFAVAAARGAAKIGALDEAERFYREAITIAEDQRVKRTNRPELRPWVLARGATPYIELLALVASQGRGMDALVLSESLHARTWLDQIVDDGGGRAEALRNAELRRQAPTVEPLTADALRARLGDRQAVVFVTRGSSTWRLDVIGGSVAVVALTAEDQAAITAFRAAPDDRAAAARAAPALLPTDVAARRDPLYVVAGGPLADVPFAALVVDGRRVVETRAIARLPGLAALGCRARSWSEAEIFVGDAEGDLPAAAAEVRQVAGPGAAVHIGAAATRARVLEAGAAATLHAAVHGRVTRAGATLTLADGVVTASDVLAHGVGPRVAILTGCATSAALDAEAWDGFPSAFLAAGSEHVVATLRTVPDRGAAQVVAAYYAQPATLGPVERLAAAQRALLADATLSADVWAAFSVWGDAACRPAAPPPTPAAP
jgi:tetratricopeptide (TPR) repeat protein